MAVAPLLLSAQIEELLQQDAAPWSPNSFLVVSLEQGTYSAEVRCSSAGATSLIVHPETSPPRLHHQTCPARRAQRASPGLVAELVVRLTSHDLARAARSRREEPGAHALPPLPQPHPQQHGTVPGHRGEQLGDGQLQGLGASRACSMMRVVHDAGGEHRRNMRGGERRSAGCPDLVLVRGSFLPDGPLPAWAVGSGKLARADAFMSDPLLVHQRGQRAGEGAVFAPPDRSLQVYPRPLSPAPGTGTRLLVHLYAQLSRSFQPGGAGGAEPLFA
eukprot:767807-Hanusia_phi.AAC.4